MPFTAKNAKIEWTGSGGGNATEIPEVKEWSLTNESDNKAYASSSTSGRMKREPGNGDASGSFTVYAEDAATIEGLMQPGDKGTLKLYENATRFHQVEVIIDSFEPSADIEGAELVELTVNFSGNGTYTKPGGGGGGE